MATRDGSSLHVDLLATIALKSESFEYFIYFSAVCRSWNRASSSIKHQWRPASQVPWLLLAESKEENPDCVREMFNLGNNKRYKLKLPETFGARCWGSAYGWIALVKRDFTVRLFNPFTKAHISTFPSWETLSLILPNRCRTDFDWLLRHFLSRIIVLKVSQRFVVFIKYDDGRHLVFARQGDKSWTSVLISSVCDVVAAEEDGRVFAFSYLESIVCWNVNDADDASELEPMIYSHGDDVIREGNWFLYLVRLGGSDLFVVTRYVEDILNNSDETSYNPVLPYRARDFQIHKLNHQDSKWEMIDDLGDVVLFVGNNSSMSVSVVSPMFATKLRIFHR